MGQEGGIQARPVGRVLRLLTGIALVVEGGRHLIGAGSSLILLTAGVVAGEFVFYAALHLVVSRFFRSVNAWLGAVLAVAPVAIVFFLSNAPGQLVLCSQSLFRFADLGDDGLCRGGPDKGCGVIVSAINVVVDRLD